VGFRWSLCREAEALGLNGWVRNRSDGSVEALAWGEPAAVGRLVAWSHEGPPSAQVSRVEVTEGAPDGASQIGFEQRPTL